MLEHMPGQLTQAETQELASVKSVSDLCSQWASKWRSIAVEVQFLAKFIYPRGSAVIAMLISVADSACGVTPPPTPPPGTLTNTPVP
jgi:hypothetical protein